MNNRFKIAAVLLNYNSEDDLFISASQIKQQKGIDLITIIVDNNSNPENVSKLKEFEQNLDKNSYSGTKDDIYKLIEKQKLDKNKYKIFFIYNDVNNGYSAGNNIGVKIADYLEVDAVLIANPDMRFDDDNYIFHLANVLFSNKKYFIVASKILGLDGEDQNPWREANFLEEFLWPLWKFKKKSYIIKYPQDKIITVPKVCGCCFMAKMSFLREIKYFDENTFLYSEEPILSVQVNQKGGLIAFTPFVQAIHAHKKSEKGNSSKRMLLFIKSRKYYLKKYSGYNAIQLYLLNISYGLLKSIHSIKQGLK